MSYLCTVKRALVLYIIFIQLLSYFSAAATSTAARNSEVHQEASIAAASFMRDQPAELTPSPHFTCTGFKVRDQRFVHSLLVITGFHSNNPGKLNTIAAIPYLPPYRPLIRLLLYPKHYFW